MDISRRSFLSSSHLILRGKPRVRTAFLVFKKKKRRVLLFFWVIFLVAQNMVVPNLIHPNSSSFMGDVEFRIPRDQTRNTYDSIKGPVHNEVSTNQYYTKPKGTRSPCEKVISYSFSSTLSQSQSRCLQLPDCVSVSRHRVTGLTLFCIFPLKPKPRRRWYHHITPAVWTSTEAGGCQDIPLDRALGFHSSNSAGCKSLGLADYTYERLERDAIPCHVIWSGQTESLQRASITCTSTLSCLKLVRYASGQTYLCAQKSTKNSRSRNTIAYTRSIDVKDNVVVGTFRSNHSVFKNGVFSSKIDSGPELFSVLRRFGFGGIEQDHMRFYVVTGTLDCSAEQIIYENVFALSVQHAMGICHLEPHCTAFTYEESSRSTTFCQGYRTLSSSARNKPCLSAFKPGFEHYRGEQAYSEAAAGKIPEPGISSCPSPLVAIPVNVPSTVTLPIKVSCDECAPDGICGNLLNKDSFTADQARSFDSSVQSAKDYALRHINVDTSMFRGLNPSIFKVGKKEMVTFRATSASRCHGKSIAATWEIDRVLPTYNSYVVVCEISRPKWLTLKNSCFLVREPKSIREISNTKYHYELSDKTSSFVGLEDPRGFTFSGRAFILCNVGVDIHSKDTSFKTRFPNGKAVRQMLLVTLNGKVASRYVLVSLPDSTSRRANEGDVKNVMPLVSDDDKDLVLVYSVDPLLLCSLDVRSGICSRVNESQPSYPYSRDTNSKYIGRWSGSTPFVKTSAGYLGMVHRKQSLTLGRMYTHKWLLLDGMPPFRQIWSSGSFRLPSIETAVYSDIQFAAGVVVDELLHTAYISYGVGDCFSLIGQFDLPTASNFSAIIDSPSLIQRSDNFIRVKWEGPLSDHSGFGSAARELWKDPALHEHADVRFLDTSQYFQLEKDSLEPILKERLILSHLQDQLHSDITIRFGWPLNFNPVNTGKLVLYFPWEFYYIPESWVSMINTNIDEVWTPSDWCKRGFKASGVLRDVHVIPHGSPEVYCGKVLEKRSTRAKYKFFRAGQKTLKLLYHGGNLWRKGIDLTLRSYAEAFGPSDDVILIIHSVYGDDEVNTFVKHYVQENKHVLAKVKLISRALSGEEIDLLYKETDLLLHLSRSEGFGLSILEAMAQGVPVMVPDIEPMSDFVSPVNGFLIPAYKKLCNKYPCLRGGKFVFSQDLPVGSGLFWHEVDVTFASAILRDILVDRDLIKVRQQAARETACSSWAWDTARKIVSQRMKSLAHQ